MSGNFIDSNVALYALDPLSSKGKIAAGLLEKPHHTSTQVIMESVNVMIKKLGFSRHDAYESARFFLFGASIVMISNNTILKAFEISEWYQYSHWDSLIIAAALEANCSTLLSEDLKDGQTIEGSLKISNPFR